MCKMCKRALDISAFYKTNHYSRYECKQCENKKRTNWRIQNARIQKKKAVEYLGGRCSRCGYDACVYALEFNHLDPTSKEYEPTRLFQKGLAWERVKVEIDKCELLCSNWALLTNS